MKGGFEELNEDKNEEGVEKDGIEHGFTINKMNIVNK